MQLLIARNPDPDSRLPYLLWVPLGGGMVFQAWTDPAKLTHWFAPEGFTAPLPSIVAEVRPGGPWSVSMVSPDGNEVVIDGTYREVVPGSRLVFTTGDPEHAQGRPASVVTVIFTDINGATRMDFHQAGVNTDAAHADGAKAGWNQFFDRLRAYLDGESAQSSPDSARDYRS